MNEIVPFCPHPTFAFSSFSFFFSSFSLSSFFICSSLQLSFTSSCSSFFWPHTEKTEAVTELHDLTQFRDAQLGSEMSHSRRLCLPFPLLRIPSLFSISSLSPALPHSSSPSLRFLPLTLPLLVRFLDPYLGFTPILPSKSFILILIFQFLLLNLAILHSAVSLLI